MPDAPVSAALPERIAAFRFREVPPEVVARAKPEAQERPRDRPWRAPRNRHRLLAGFAALGLLTEPHAVRRLLASLGLAAEPPPRPVIAVGTAP